MVLDQDLFQLELQKSYTDCITAYKILEKKVICKWNVTGSKAVADLGFPLGVPTSQGAPTPDTPTFCIIVYRNERIETLGGAEFAPWIRHCKGTKSKLKVAILRSSFSSDARKLLCIEKSSTISSFNHSNQNLYHWLFVNISQSIHSHWIVPKFR